MRTLFPNLGLAAHLIGSVFQRLSEKKLFYNTFRFCSFGLLSTRHLVFFDLLIRLEPAAEFNACFHLDITPQIATLCPLWRLFSKMQRA